MAPKSSDEGHLGRGRKLQFRKDLSFLTTKSNVTLKTFATYSALKASAMPGSREVVDMADGHTHTVTHALKPMQRFACIPKCTTSFFRARCHDASAEWPLP